MARREGGGGVGDAGAGAAVPDRAQCARASGRAHVVAADARPALAVAGDAQTVRPMFEDQAQATTPHTATQPATTPSGEPRRFPETDARRPDIASDLARTEAVCRHAAAAGAAALADVVRAVADAVGRGAGAGDLDEVVVDAAVVQVARVSRFWAGQLCREVDGDAADAGDAPRLRARAAGERGRRAEALAEAADAVEAAEAAEGGALAARLRGVWEATGAVSPRGPEGIDAGVARLAADGADGDRLAWEIIAHESHRHLGLVWREAHKLARTLPQRRASELVGYGWQGLRTALRKYEPDQSAFSTYACTRINGDIRAGVRSEHPLPKRLTTYARKVQRAEDELASELGRAPALAELAERLDQHLDELRIVPRLQPAASVEELTAGEDTGDRPRSPSWLAGGDDPADEAVAALRSEAVADAIDQLDEPERTAARALLLEGRASTEVAEETGYTSRELLAAKRRARSSLARALADWAPASAAA